MTMIDPRLHNDISEIKDLVRELTQDHQKVTLSNESRMTRLESRICEIKANVEAIRIRGNDDHDDITSMKSQLAIRPAAAAIISTAVSVMAAYFGLRPSQ